MKKNISINILEYIDSCILGLVSEYRLDNIQLTQYYYWWMLKDVILMLIRILCFIFFFTLLIDWSHFIEYTWIWIHVGIGIIRFLKWISTLVQTDANHGTIIME